MASPAVQQDGRVRRRMLVQGVVQGVGFRPFVYATATELRLTGSVANSAAGVVVEVEGEPPPSTAFARRLRRATPPPLAVVEAVDAHDVATARRHRVSPSAVTPGRRPAAPWPPRTSPPAPTACAELADPADRRYRHPFINCTNCGPRFTIIAVAALRPRRRRRWPASRCAPTAPASTPTPPTAASTPSRSPAPTAGPRSTLPSTADGDVTGGEAALRRARALLRDGGVARGQGHRRLPPRLRRRQRGGGRRAAPAQAARRQAVRGDGAPTSATARAARRDRRRRSARAAHRPAAPDRAAAARGDAPRRRPGRRSAGRARQPRPRRACWPTRRCTCCCSGCPATRPGPTCW